MTDDEERLAALQAELINISALVADYWKSLIVSGLPQDAATSIAIGYQALLLCR